jgi:uncharacterized membrane protein YidH (DUF202 family)
MKDGKRKKEADSFAELEVKRKKEEQKRLSAGEKREYDFERSRIASEKLQLAWVKANITFTGLGFAVYKFYQSRLEHGNHPIGHYITGRHLGLFLTLVGVGALALATWQHYHKVSQLKMKYAKEYRSVSLLLSYVVLGFDAIIMAMILFHL